MRSIIRRLGAFLSTAPTTPTIQHNTPIIYRTWVGAGTDDNWSTPENWLFGVVPESEDAVIFQGTARPNTHNDLPNLIVHSITFAEDAAAFTIDGNSIVLCEAIANLSAKQQTISIGITLTNTSTINSVGNAVSLTGLIGGIGGIIKSGPYALTLDKDNTYTGGTIIVDGTLHNKEDTSCCFGAGDITISSATATLFLRSGVPNNINNNVFNGRLVLASPSGVMLTGNLIVNNTLNILAAATKHTISGNISGSGSIYLKGVGASGGLIISSNNNPLTGSIVVMPDVTLQTHDASLVVVNSITP